MAAWPTEASMVYGEGPGSLPTRAYGELNFLNSFSLGPQNSSRQLVLQYFEVTIAISCLTGTEQTPRKPPFG